jgi:phosphoribosyl 1,2-cyclic phosphate phosphodiesterase
VQSLNNNIKTIDAVLWTHAHADHANGIDDLRQFLWTKKEELPVYGSLDTINSLKHRFDYVFSKTNNYFQPPLNVNIIEEGKFNVCGHDAIAFNQVHGKEITFGYRFGNFAYSTDVKEFPKESQKYLYGLDLWIVDCVRFEPHYSHSHFEQTISWINKYKPKKAILTHLGAWLDYDKLLKLCPDNVFPAYDGLSINLT